MHQKQPPAKVANSMPGSGVGKVIAAALCDGEQPLISATRSAPRSAPGRAIQDGVCDMVLFG